MRYIDFKKRLFFLFAVVIKKIGLDSFLKILSEFYAVSSPAEIASIESILAIDSKFDAKISECISSNNSSILRLQSDLDAQIAEINNASIETIIELIKSKLNALSILNKELLNYAIDICYNLPKIDAIASNVVSISNKEGIVKINIPSKINATSGIQYDISLVNNYLKILVEPMLSVCIADIVNISTKDFETDIVLPKIEVNFPRMRTCKIDSCVEMKSLLNIDFASAIVSSIETKLNLSSDFVFGKTAYRKMNDLLDISSSIFLTFSTDKLFEIEIKI